MNEWTNEWVNEWVIEWIHEWMNEWVSEWIHEWVNERMSEWMNEWVNEWMNEWMKKTSSTEDGIDLCFHSEIRQRLRIYSANLKQQTALEFKSCCQKVECHVFTTWKRIIIIAIVIIVIIVVIIIIIIIIIIFITVLNLNAHRNKTHTHTHTHTRAHMEISQKLETPPSLALGRFKFIRSATKVIYLKTCFFFYFVFSFSKFFLRDIPQHDMSILTRK